MSDQIPGGERAQFVVFQLDNTEFGVPINQVARIVRLMEITRVPRAPAFVEGVINLQGEIVPVIDLKKRFSQKSEGIHGDDKARILIVELPDESDEWQLVGLLVDAVTEIRWLPASDVGEMPPMLEGISPAYLAGVGRVGERLIVILDLDRVLYTREMGDLSELSRVERSEEA
ncbi:MAG: chemotaxis protein CheW [Chloroflexota bacterium]|nr:chemotaxis protein CheW [Chloroflexota bacterium]